MKSREREHVTGLVGGLLAVAAVLLVVLRDAGGSVDVPPPPPASIERKKPARPPSAPRPRVVRDAGSSVSPEEFSEELGDLGCTATATGDGQLRITGPGEVVLDGLALEAAPRGDGFLLRGNLGMRTGSTYYKTEDGEGYLHIRVDGAVRFSPGKWQSVNEK